MMPDYRGGGLANLIASIAEACGGQRRHAPLAALEGRALAEARNIVLVIVDGLGERYLSRHPGSELARRRRAAITSVFPSTTASAITTSYTACTPLEHGLTGWYAYFGEAGYVAAPLPFRTRGDDIPLARAGLAPAQAFPAAPIFASLARRSIVVTFRDIVDSAYNVRHCAGAERVAYASLEEFVARTEQAVKSGPDEKFVYAYWPEYDAVCHRHGCESREALAAFERIDSAFAALLERLSGTDSVVLATADHGFIDVPPEDALELPASLAAQLRFPLCGERRVAYCHVHHAPRFVEEARAWLGARADVRPSAELVAEGWFGGGVPHPRFAERVGDVTLVMRGRTTVKDWTPGEPRHLHIGNHGGTSDDEMMIPLIVEER